MSSIQGPLPQGPDERVDLRPERVTPARLAASLVALANADGGTVILGFEGRPPRPVGVSDPQRARDLAIKAALLCEPPLIIPLPEVIRHEGRDFLRITVPAGLPHVYSVGGRYLRRDGRRNRPLSATELRRLMLERGKISFEDQPVREATQKDLNWDKVERYVAGLEGMANLAPEAVLRQRGCLTPSGKPTYAGILLFGREPWRFVRGAEIIAVRYAGLEMDDEYVREDIRDTLPEQIRRAEAFVVQNMRVSARLSGLEREERPEYPREAVREAIVNAVAHRDYGLRGQEIRVFMFADRLEVYSPGRLPGHITVENIVEERFSRNETIVQVLADMGFIERLGYGIDRMIRLMREYGLPDPVFEETAAGFKVTLYGAGGELSPVADDRRLWARMGLNQRQQKALEYLIEHGRITNREYQELCPDVSPETIRRDLADLVRRNLLLKIGEKRGTYYILK